MTIALRPAKSQFYDGEEYPPAKPIKFDIVSNDRIVGYIEAFKINRHAARETGDFHLAVEHFSQGIYDFARVLFEQQSGKFRSNYYNGRRFQRGTGSFGQELDGVNFIFIEELLIEAETDRQHGIGTAALKKFHDMHKNHYPFIFTLPGILGGHDLSASARQDQRDHLVAFYHKNGYRRVGNTQYFAFAQDESHASRRLLAEDDARGEPTPTRSPEEMTTAFPLHHKILATHLQLFDIIRDIDIGQIRLQDDLGQTPLHYAAESGKFVVAMALLERSTDELFLENAYGQTPLVAAQDTVTTVEEMLCEKMLDPYTLMTMSGDRRILQIATKPLTRVLREFMDYILDARKQGLPADMIQGHINARIAEEKEAFWGRSKAFRKSSYDY